MNLFFVLKTQLDNFQPFFIFYLGPIDTLDITVFLCCATDLDCFQLKLDIQLNYIFFCLYGMSCFFTVKADFFFSLVNLEQTG